MAKTESTSTTEESTAAQVVAHELFELEGKFLRIRDLTYAVRMAASSGEISKEVTDAMSMMPVTPKPTDIGKCEH
jgi:hypothetical protein